MSLRAKIEQRFGNYSQSQRDALLRYAELVHQFAPRMNLTAAKTDEESDAIFFADADALASCAEELALGQQNILRCVDIGAGAGAPAIPFSILCPQAHFTLVEPLRKRVSFLRTAVGTLGIANRFKVLEQKLNWDAPDVPEMPFDLAISRATVAPAEWLEGGQKLAPRVAVFHSSSEHSHPNLTCVTERHFSVYGDKNRFVGIFGVENAARPRALDTKTRLS